MEEFNSILNEANELQNQFNTKMMELLKKSKLDYIDILELCNILNGKDLYIYSIVTILVKKNTNLIQLIIEELKELVKEMPERENEIKRIKNKIDLLSDEYDLLMEIREREMDEFKKFK
jgi:hypothetical protein